MAAGGKQDGAADGSEQPGCPGQAQGQPGQPEQRPKQCANGDQSSGQLALCRRKR